ncbi:hypothetical protein BGW41_005625 [Actinomortierella wolfii]|nr:hypothetical protein BGW41_005625 [Actinomortierella wolfii]
MLAALYEEEGGSGKNGYMADGLAAVLSAVAPHLERLAQRNEETLKRRGISPVDLEPPYVQAFPGEDWRLKESEPPERQSSSPSVTSRSPSRPHENDLVMSEKHDTHEDDYVQATIDTAEYDQHDHNDALGQSEEPADADETEQPISDAENTPPTTSNRPKANAGDGKSANRTHDRVILETHLSAPKRRVVDEIEDSEFDDDGEEHNVGPLKKRVKKTQLQLPMEPRDEEGGPSGSNGTNNIARKVEGGQARKAKPDGRQYVHWSREELQRLKELVPRFKPDEVKMWGKRRVEVNWAQLKRYDDEHGAILKDRTQVQLKDKWRYISKNM